MFCKHNTAINVQKMINIYILVCANIHIGIKIRKYARNSKKVTVRIL